MNVYLLEVNDGEWDYDEPRKCVVIADSARHARLLAPATYSYLTKNVYKFRDPSKSTIKKINMDKPKVILVESHEG